MFKWNTTEMALFKTLVQTSQSSLMKSMSNYLKKNYQKEKIKVSKDNFIFCEGNIPVMLVAHLDTVFQDLPKHIYYDKDQYTLWSSEGLGADDRAGVFLIWKIIHSGYRPHICLTTDEEMGGIGAKAFVHYFPKPAIDCKYIIELDRQGINDCVFYNCGNEEFQEYVESFGFSTDWGTFTDISIICPMWKIAGVNLSVGYKNEHSLIETLNVKAMYDTFYKVCKMLDSIGEAKYFKYIENIFNKYYSSLGKAYNWNMYPGEEDDDGIDIPVTQFATQKCECWKCKKSYNFDDIFEVKTNQPGFKHIYCLDCIDERVDWCVICGEPFETEDKRDYICVDCKQRIATNV